ncbi:MAG: metalloregulator ArsR/SmtB family transcription factor [Pseudomonadota bacterium]
MTDVALPDAELDNAADRLEALGSPVRLRIVRELVRVGENGLPVSGLQERVGVAPSTLSHHLRKLVAVDLIVQERQGTTLLCRAQYDTIRSLADFLLSECCVEDAGPAGGC